MQWEVFHATNLQHEYSVLFGIQTAMDRNTLFSVDAFKLIKSDHMNMINMMKASTNLEGSLFLHPFVSVKYLQFPTKLFKTLPI